MFGWFKKEKINQEQRQSESNISEKTTTNNKDESILKVGVMNNVAPNVFKVLETHKDTIKSQNTGEYVAGFDIDLIKEIAENLELKLEIYVFDFKGILGALNQNKIDLSITSMSITEERAKTLDVSKAYTQTETSMVVRKSDKRFDDLRKTKEIDYDSFCDKLKDLGREKPISFITFQNTTAIPIIDKIQKQVNEDQIIRIKKDNELDSHTACFQNIKLKKSDIFIIDSYLAMVACKINDDLDYFYMTSNNLENSACPQGLGIFFPKEEKNDEDRRIPNLQKSINESLVKLNLVKKDDKGKFQDIIDLKKQLNELNEDAKNPNTEEDKEKIEQKIKEIKENTKQRLEKIFTQNKKYFQKQGTYYQIKKTLPSYLKGLQITLVLALDSLIVGFLLASLYTLMKKHQSQ